MNTTKLLAALAGGLAAGTWPSAWPLRASADYDTNGYINALDAEGLIDHDGRSLQKCLWTVPRPIR